eukprot:TRINITY_DN6193_c0_g1_i12.p2 TRINITY_DN6193_c0_g1~~TRINITY_DN6193_c0_g1_i12.p2  ORF type:complete len:132 (-),score=3.93 TRINITY_DN6193_c0_g1_i12:104-499(-)
MIFCCARSFHKIKPSANKRDVNIKYLRQDQQPKQHQLHAKEVMSWTISIVTSSLSLMTPLAPPQKINQSITSWKRGGTGWMGPFTGKLLLSLNKARISRNNPVQRTPGRTKAGKAKKGLYPKQATLRENKQ